LVEIYFEMHKMSSLPLHTLVFNQIWLF